jgi:hypothetical protein
MLIDIHNGKGAFDAFQCYFVVWPEKLQYPEIFCLATIEIDCPAFCLTLTFVR